MLGYKDRSAALHPTHGPLIVPGNNGMFQSTLVIDGQVTGTWKRTIKKNTVIITLSHFRRLTTAEKRLVDEAAHGYASFLAAINLQVVHS